MFAALALLFLVVPFLELFVAIKVAHVIGGVPTVASLVVVSAVGAALVKRAGLDVWRRARAQLDERRMPGRELVDGALILLAAALLVMPGFVTDLLGLALLVPPVRTGILKVAIRFLETRIAESRPRRGQGEVW